MEKILIRIADEKDAESIFDFKCKHFDEINPVELAYPKRGNAGRGIRPIIDAISHGTVLMAIERETDKLVGFLSASPIYSDSLEKVKEFTKTTPNQKQKEIYSFFIYIEEKADLFGKFDVAEPLQIQLASVHPDFLGQGIASRLFEEIFKLAKEKNYKLISVECSSVYTAKISEKFGMDCIATVSYQEYNDHIGKNVFKPVEPHTEIKVYAKRL